MTRVELHPLSLPGSAVVTGPVPVDERGSFYKVVQRSVFEELGLPSGYDEQFFSRSRRGVVRGLHLQLPPSEQWKLVTCLAGAAHDVLLDLRKASPTYGQHLGLELAADSGSAVLVPPGVAHGFLALQDDTLMGYWVTAEHDPGADAGVRWDSAGISWPCTGDPIVSARDRALPALQDFVSPFDGQVHA